MPVCYMFIGLPGSGKSTFLKKYRNQLPVISTDSYIEKKADEAGLTYNDVFSEYISEATDYMYDELRALIESGSDFVWDQTNLNRKTRFRKLSMIPETYEKIAVHVICKDQEEWNRRLSNRPGKNIPGSVLNSMKNSMESPSLEEGFSQIITIET